MKIALCLIGITAVSALAASADRGVVGITVDRSDFTVVTSVLPDSPAADAGIRVGDRIVAIGGFPTSKLATMEEFISRVSGPVDSEVELQLKRADSGSLLRVRLRRVAQPSPAPLKPPGDFNPSPARSEPQV